MIISSSFRFLNAIITAAFLLIGDSEAAWPWSKRWSIDDAKFDFTGDRNHDICVCYWNGYDAGATKPPISSADYETGYKLCRAQVSPAADGARAWTTGYLNGQSSGWGKRSCTSYLRNIDSSS